MVESHHLSQALQALIRERIHSVEQLETLLLLRAGPVRAWSHREVADTLRINAALARLALEELVKSDLCLRHCPEGGPTTFVATTSQCEAALLELAETYQAHRIAVLVFISQAAIARVRMDARRTFTKRVPAPKEKKKP